ncbi:unnamed protein product [Soboliphyme baturini]|uniref:Lig_chan-Glu_bd domain-containing protein n=1 Tax=Soboliphyme baturini TaxID=241478 RepID=A0A183ITL4_9BILA|nr:unnamed protein product [Soboliphyme baturini]
MVQGWFDAFRHSGSPTWYGDHRTPVIAEVTTVLTGLLFVSLFSTFMIIFPGVRKAVSTFKGVATLPALEAGFEEFNSLIKRWSSLLAFTQTLFIGSAVLGAYSSPSWHRAELSINAPYRSFSEERLFALLGVKIGLSHMNVTLQSLQTVGQIRYLDFNERFYFLDVKSMEKNLRSALRSGLPYPIITVIEYMSMDKGGLSWGRRYRLGGYYTKILLW